MLAPILRIVATFAMTLIMGAVWSIVDAPDAYAAEAARKATDNLTFKIIAAYLILALVCWGIFWVVAGGWRRDR